MDHLSIDTTSRLKPLFVIFFALYFFVNWFYFLNINTTVALKTAQPPKPMRRRFSNETLRSSV